MRPPGLRELASHEQLVRATGGSSFVRCDLPSVMDGPAHALDGAVVVPRRTHTGRRGVLVMGEAGGAARLVQWLLDDGLLPDPPVNLTVARHAMVAVAPLLSAAQWRVTRTAEWDWMCTRAAPPPVAAETRLVRLDETDEADIRAVLDEANQGTDARPFEGPDQQWVGARDHTGRLVACGVVEPGAAGQPVLAGITVLAPARGTGLGLAVTAYLTRLAVTTHGLATLGMYADNDVARRVYLGLGYGDVHQWSSRRLEA